MLPRMPVMITATTVMAWIPPRLWETLMVMGVVTDLGSREAVTDSSNRNRRHRP